LCEKSGAIALVHWVLRQAGRLVGRLAGWLAGWLAGRQNSAKFKNF